jgi:tRNA (adenine37-N6)-methyltransferase
MQESGKLPCEFSYEPVGVIHSPWTDIKGMPIQPAGARGVKGTVEVFEKFAEGLNDIEGFSRIILIYSFHKCTGSALTVKPFLDPTPRGVFATRAPRRPNAIGLSIVRLSGRTGRMLAIEDVDVLDGTPVLDIKPYVPLFDSYPDAADGWFGNVAKNAEHCRSDGRFR